MASSVSAHWSSLILREVNPTGKEIGRGAYGRVFEVNYEGTFCAAKEVHALLLQYARGDDLQKIKDDFLNECQIWSTLRHPCVVQFLGVYYPYMDQHRLPVMVMEKMQQSLRDLLNNYDNIPLNVKLSILDKVCLGLRYLHSRNPPIVHTDLTPNNILLGGCLEAKITDLGIAKLMKFDNQNTMTKLPGLPDFMPPEALSKRPTYGPSLDVFSYGGIILNVTTQLWPEPTDRCQFNPDTEAWEIVSEVKRRQHYFERMIGSAADLKPLVMSCLNDNPKNRPSVVQVSMTIKRTKDVFSEESSCDGINPIVWWAKVCDERQLQVTNSLTTTLKEMATSNEQLQKEIDILKTNVIQLKTNNDVIKDENKQLRINDVLIKNENKQLRTSIDTMKEENKQLRINNTTLKNEIGQLKAENSMIKDKNVQSKIENNLKAHQVDTSSLLYTSPFLPKKDKLKLLQQKPLNNSNDALLNKETITQSIIRDENISSGCTGVLYSSTPVVASNVSNSYQSPHTISSVSQYKYKVPATVKVSRSVSTSSLTFGNNVKILPTIAIPEVEQDEVLLFSSGSEMVSFADLASAAKSTGRFGGIGLGSSSNKGFAGAGKPLFSSQTDKENNTLDSFESTAEFKPIVKLSSDVKLQSGEEDEIVLFSHRAKLYRFDPSVKQWKERGTGKIKLLKHKKTGKCRILMRREQILKLCCNHWIAKDMILTVRDEKVLQWMTFNDFSDEETKAEQFSVRFKLEDTARSFQQIFNDCLSNVDSAESTSLQSFATESTVQATNSSCNPPNTVNNCVTSSCDSTTTSTVSTVEKQTGVTSCSAAMAAALILPSVTTISTIQSAANTIVTSSYDTTTMFTVNTIKGSSAATTAAEIFPSVNTSSAIQSTVNNSVITSTNTFIVNTVKEQPSVTTSSAAMTAARSFSPATTGTTTSPTPFVFGSSGDKPSKLISNAKFSFTPKTDAFNFSLNPASSDHL